MSPDSLPEPAIYFPIRNGRYDVAPNLVRLGTDFGNGITDGHAFQIDTEYGRYLANKAACRRLAYSDYVLEDEMPTAVTEAATRRIVERLVSEHPSRFALQDESRDVTVLHCSPTRQSIRFERSTMRRIVGDQDHSLRYENALDALLSQVQEDCAIVRRSPERGDWIAALHVCAPSHWAPATKIGKDFDVAHAPVPGMEKIRKAAKGMVSAMITGDPTVRFTFGIEFDNDLNHHPPALVEPGKAREPRRFDARVATPLWLRVERQVVLGLPDVDAALFLIRVYCYDGRVIRADPTRRDALVSALRSMSTDSREYKSLDGCGDDVIRWLQSGAE